MSNYHAGVSQPSSRRTTVRRHPERGVYERQAVFDILDEASAKVRTGPPKDREEDYGLPIWAGELPLKLTPAEPIPDPRLSPEIPIPDHVARYRR